MSTPDTRRTRIGHEERETAVRELGDHFAEGRLEPDEYEERVSAAYAARFSDDLHGLFDDLPRPGDAATVALQGSQAVTQDAPYGRDPVSGRPYSDRYQVVAGVLQLILPVGLGRFYTGHTGIAVAQLLAALTVIGAIWPFLDGIVILTGHPTDSLGRPLRA